jgi:hypothetical protein
MSLSFSLSLSSSAISGINIDNYKEFARSDVVTTAIKSSVRSYFESNFYNEVFGNETIMLRYANEVMEIDQPLCPVSVPLTCVNTIRKCTVYMHKYIGYFMQAKQVKRTICKTSNAVQHISNAACSTASTAEEVYS